MTSSNRFTRYFRRQRRRQPTRLAFVLSGGGALGALQVGALQALLDAQIKPDLLAGTYLLNTPGQRSRTFPLAS